MSLPATAYGAQVFSTVRRHFRAVAAAQQGAAQHAAAQHANTPLAAPTNAPTPPRLANSGVVPASGAPTPLRGMRRPASQHSGEPGAKLHARLRGVEQRH